MFSFTKLYPVPNLFWQICVRCPFDYGVLDGLLLLLCELLAQVIWFLIQIPMVVSHINIQINALMCLKVSVEMTKCQYWM